LLAAHFLDRRNITDLGVVKDKNAFVDYHFGFVLAFLLVGTMLFIELNCGLARIKSVQMDSLLTDPGYIFGIFDGFISCLMIGFHEELLRFYQIKNFSEGLSGYKWLGKKGAVISATVLASTFFGVLHMGNNGVTPLAVLLLFLDGLFLSLIYITTGSGWLAFGFHAAWDFAEGNVFGFPVSGYPENYSLIRVEQIGNQLATGGAFGPDGGLINFVMVIFGAIGIFLWVRFRHKITSLKLELCDWSGQSNRVSTSAAVTGED
jgi:membrane protease YdiL (CAAX protease family)